ncbi:acyl carrier protein [Hallella seregens]|uniref:Acyl carrier protein n=1 Tax=Hallella seregens ATCC 51272 TaxID=1336250 RepID=A0ABV5ZKV9_9BACT|nr:acyl carrier protein [Hallella seregens]
MKINDFIKNLAEQFDDTDTLELTPITKFKELEEWSSLVALSIIAMVDDEYEVSIKGDDIRNSETVEDLFNVVSARV